MNRVSSFFQSFLPFLFFMAIQIILTIVMMIVYTIRAVSSGQIDGGFTEYLNNLPTNPEFTQVVSILFAVIGIIVFTAWYRKAFVRPLRSQPRKYWSGVSFQVVIGLILFAFGLQYVAQLIAEGIGIALPELLETYNEMMAMAGYEEMSWLLIIYAIILAPISEELVFRGLTMRIARGWLPFWGANIFQAILFGVMHMNAVQGIYAFALGIFLGWICQQGHSLKYSIALHILFNLLGTIFIDFFDVTLTLSKPGFYAVGVALTIFAMLIFRREFQEKNVRQRKKYESEIVE